MNNRKQKIQSYEEFLCNPHKSIKMSSNGIYQGQVTTTKRESIKDVMMSLGGLNNVK